MNRRGFLGSMLAACAAPAIVRADSLMRMVPRETLVLPTPGSPAWLRAIREIRQYDITHDAFITRWDVAGIVNGSWEQFNVSMYSEYNGPLYVSSNEGQPISVAWAKREAADREHQREIAVRTIREHVEREGMLVVKNRLTLPAGVHDARFLA